MAALLVAGCTQPAAADPPCPCEAIHLTTDPVTDPAALLNLLVEVQARLFPETMGIDLDVAPVDDLRFFRAWVDLATLGEPDPRARRYTIQYDPVVLQDPPSPAALAAVLGHELGHVEDYLGMDSAELVEFGIWYGSQDPYASDELAAYERATDEKVLTRGCASGLSEIRSWIYAHADAATLDEKRRNYFTPEEIAVWVEQHGSCSEFHEPV